MAKLTLGVGTYSIVAKFQALSFALASASPPQPLIVDANASYLSFSNITSSGTAGNYTLTGTVAAFGRNVPTGTVSFLDIDSKDSLVGTAVLDPATLGFAPAFENLDFQCFQQLQWLLWTAKHWKVRGKRKNRG